MTQNNILYVKLSNSLRNKLKSGIKHNTKVTLKLSSNFIGDSNAEINSPHKLLLTNIQLSRLCKTFANGSSANKKLSKNQLHKTEQSGDSLKQLAKRVLIPLRLTALRLIVSATDAAIHKKMFGSSRSSDLALHLTTSIVLNEEMNEMMKKLIHLKNLAHG